MEAHLAFHKANGKRSRKVIGTNVLSDDELWVLQIIADYMRLKGSDVSSVEMLRTSQDFTAFARKVPLLMEFIRKQKLDRTQRRMLLGLALEIMYEEKTAMRTACSARVIMREIHRVPALLDSQFPGYARAGLLPMVVRAHQERREAAPHYAEDDD